MGQGRTRIRPQIHHVPAGVDTQADLCTHRLWNLQLVNQPARGEIRRHQIIAPVGDQYLGARMLEQRRLERGHRQAGSTLPAFALPVPLPRHVGSENEVGEFGTVAERVGRIGVERGAEIGGGRLQQRVAGVIVLFAGGRRPRDRAVIEADRLTPGAQDLAGEDTARDAAAVAAHDVLGKPDDLGDSWR